MRETALAARVDPTSIAPLLAVRNLEAWYGESHVLHGIDFEVASGEVVTLLGRNGAGKTTTLKSIIGILPKRRGSVVFDGAETIRLPSRAIARLGVGYVPEERGIFASLSVEENLILPPQVKPGGLSLEQIGRTIARLKKEGFTIVLVEQNFRFASTVADRHYVVEQGRIIDMIPNADLENNVDKLHAYLGV